MECISPCLSCLCGRLTEGFGSSVQAQAEGGLSFLGGLAGRALLDCLEKRRSRVELQPTETAVLVGAEETLTAIRGHLNNNEVDAVGIVGMGGVGKTTLLKNINNDFYWRGTSKFDKVIFVTVSSEGDALKVRKEIAQRLGLSESSGDGSGLSRIVYNALSHETYLLLLDDVWGDLDLKEIGVPLPNKENRCKIVLSTRSPDVFDRFASSHCRPRERARQLDVRKLDEHRSWELFRSMVDPTVDLDDPSILPLAEKMVQKCDGLPLALVTVGSAMAGATLAAEWREAERKWEKSPYRLKDMDQVKSSLMFSIDWLEPGTLLPCFLYCSLFPADEEVIVDELIEYWIGEGLLDGEDTAPHLEDRGVYGSIYESRDKGEIVIKKLKGLCLLETGRRTTTVRMHDLVREVVNEERNRFLVNSPDWWEQATRVSMKFHYREEGSLLEMPCSTRVLAMSMPSGSRFKQSDGRPFPLSVVSEFYELALPIGSRGSSTILTSIVLFSELRYLNLSGSCISSLPEELGNLHRLRQLVLSWTPCLEKIPQQAIVRLSNLQVLNMFECGYEWGLEGGENSIGGAGNNGDLRLLRVSDLGEMEQLQDLGITITHLGVLQSFLNGKDFLLKSVTRLVLKDGHGLPTDTLSTALRSMTRLRVLRIVPGGCLTGDLILDGNDNEPLLSELEHLELWDIPLSAIIIRENVNKRGGGPLQKLKTLLLVDLSEFERLCDLPSLEYLLVDGCPLLTTLPLGPNSKISEIRCGQEWWERLEWRRDQRDARRVAELAFLMANLICFDMIVMCELLH